MTMQTTEPGRRAAKAQDSNLVGRDAAENTDAEDALTADAIAASRSPCRAPTARVQRPKQAGDFARMKRMLRKAERRAGDGSPIGGTGATILKFLGAPLCRLADRKRIGAEEIRAAGDIAIAFHAQAGALMIKPPSLEKRDATYQAREPVWSSLSTQFASTSATVISFGTVLYLHTSNGAVFELPTTSSGGYKLQFTDQTATVTFDNTGGLPSVNDTDIAAAGSEAAAQGGTGAVAVPSQQLNLGEATQVNLDQGSNPGTPVALNETGVTFNGTAAAGTQSNVKITGLTAADTLNLQGVHGGAGGVTFGATGASEYISYADTQGQPHEIQLIGFLSPGQDVYSVAAFNALNHGVITIA